MENTERFTTQLKYNDPLEKEIIAYLKQLAINRRSATFLRDAVVHEYQSRTGQIQRVLITESVRPELAGIENDVVEEDDQETLKIIADIFDSI